MYRSCRSSESPVDHRNACVSLVEDWRFRFDHRNACCRLVDAGTVRFDSCKTCMMAF